MKAETLQEGNVEKPFINPVRGVVTSLFGTRINPVTQQPELHNGLDFAVMEGTPVKAVCDGTVVEVGEDEFSGRFVRYKTTNGLSVTYAHLKSVTVEEGETIVQGQQIAFSGNTGQSSGPHLHVTMREGDTLLDPSKYLAVSY